MTSYQKQSLDMKEVLRFSTTPYHYSLTSTSPVFRESLIILFVKTQKISK